MQNGKVRDFRKLVWNYYRKHGRNDLPWRSPSLKLRRTKEILDPYKILVSEVMLQQTQVSRVIGKYKSFLRKFPTVQRLAKASFSEVLKEWNGLGYNRRTKYLHDAAKLLAKKKKITATDFEKLPGVGPYTKNAVGVFSINEPDVLIETNIRAAVIHYFYSSVSRPNDRSVGRVQKARMRDAELMPLLVDAAKGSPPTGGPREWHWALMDYGAHLKRSGVRNNHRSAHYARQSKFEGSLRQVRGAILRLLQIGPLSDIQIPPRLNLGGSKEGVDEALEGLAKDGLIKKSAQGRSTSGGGKWEIA